LVDEEAKPPEERNVLAISRIASNMLENIRTLRVLNLDTPFLNQIKSELDKARNFSRQEEQKNPYEPYPESALIIDPRSIAGKPIEARNEDYDEPVFE